LDISYYTCLTTLVFQWLLMDWLWHSSINIVTRLHAGQLRNQISVLMKSIFREIYIQNQYFFRLHLGNHHSNAFATLIVVSSLSILTVMHSSILWSTILHFM
jgi:hypothetical protein